MTMKPLLLCVLLAAMPALAGDEPVRLERICHDGELVGLRIISTGPVDFTLRWPQGICSQGDA